MNVKNWNLDWIIWLPTWVGAIGLWGATLVGDPGKGFLALTYVGMSAAFLYVGTSFAYHLFALTKSGSLGLTTARAGGKEKTSWVWMGLALSGLAAFVGGMLAAKYYVWAAVFVLLLAGYHGLKTLTTRRAKRTGLFLFRAGSSAGGKR